MRHFSTTVRFLLCSLFLSFFFSSCAVNPVTGKRELNLMSESQEVKLGAQSDPEIVAQFGLYDDPKIATFIDGMGQKMARISHRPNLAFHFRVVDSPVINAFALPGGYVYFTRGILGYMNSEAEVAGVLGHEIGHVTARHGAKAYTRAQIAQIGLAAGSIASARFRQFGDIAAQSIGLLFLKFSRDQERQSDGLGVQYSTKIGYDATNMSHFFGTLNRLRSESGQSLPNWQSTHPAPEEREAKTLALARSAQAEAQQKTFRTERNRYLKLIDGLVFGEDPRQGFVENGFFYHPQLDFQFPVPTDWQLVNTPEAVQMVNKEQSAGIQFTLAKQATAREAAETFVANSKATVNYTDLIKVNEYPAEVRQTTLAGKQGELGVLSYFIAKGGHVYTFHGFAAAKSYSKYQATFKRTMTGFNRLRNSKAKNVKPTRIKVLKVRRKTTLRDFLAKHPSKKTPPEKLAIVNGMKLTDTLKPGVLVKVLSQ